MSFKDLVTVGEEKAKDYSDFIEECLKVTADQNPGVKYKKVFSKEDMRGYMKLGYESGFQDGYLYRRREEKKSIYLLE